MDSTLHGKRAILFARCSTSGQAEDSIPQQLAILNKFKAEQHLQVVDTVQLAGVSGSRARYTSAILPTLERARRGEFDVLLCTTYDRFARLGAYSGFKLLVEFKEAGVRIVAAMEYVAESEYSFLIEQLKLREGRAYSEKQSIQSCRGVLAHILDGTIAHSMKPPYAIDRIYTTSTGKGNSLVRNLADGTQIKLDPDTKEVIGTFAIGSANHYRRQPNERIIFVPGASEHISAVRKVFHRKFIDGWGTDRIARELNNDRIPAVKGGAWNKSSVQYLFENTAYTGRGLVNKMYTGEIYFRQSPQPKLAPTNRRLQPKKFGDGIRSTLQATVRPESEWHWIEYPSLSGMLGLDSVLVDQIFDWQLNLWRRRSNGTVESGKVSHEDSAYFLKNVLVAGPAMLPMRGHSTSPRGQRYRAYRVRDAASKPRDNWIYNRTVPAELLEKKALEIVASSLGERKVIEEIVRSVLKDISKRHSDDSNNIDELLRQRKGLQQQLRRALLLEPEAETLAAEVIAQINSEASDLNKRIAQAGSTEKKNIEPNETVARVLKECEELAVKLRTNDPSLHRRIAEVLLPRVVIDFETNAVEYESHFPIWTVSLQKSTLLDVCLNGGFARKSGVQTYTQTPSIIAKCRCQLKWGKFRKPCLKCGSLITAA
jgi:hypothetical protein